MNNSQPTKLIPAAIIVLIIAVVGYYVLNTPDQRTVGQKIGDAIDELPKGPDKAARQLEDRTPGDKLQDAVKDEKQDVKKALNQQ